MNSTNQDDLTNEENLSGKIFIPTLPPSTTAENIETWEVIIQSDSNAWRNVHLQFLDLIQLQKYKFKGQDDEN